MDVRVGLWRELSAEELMLLNCGWCFWTVVLEKTLKSPLDGKEITTVNQNQSWIFIGSSVQFSHSVMSNSLQPHELKYDSILLVHHHFPVFTQTHVHWVGDAIPPPYPLSSPSPPDLNLSQHQALFKWVSSSNQVAKYWSFSFNISPCNEHSGWSPLGWTCWNPWSTDQIRSDQSLSRIRLFVTP